MYMFKTITEAAHKYGFDSMPVTAALNTEWEIILGS